jgi:hypothetical protein
MIKDRFLPLLALMGGGAGFALRSWQLAEAYDERTGLFRWEAPATIALVLLLAVMAVLFVVLLRGGSLPADYAQAFYCPSDGYLILMLAGGVLMLASAALGLWEARKQLELWQAGLTATVPVMLFLTAVMAVAAGYGAWKLARSNYRGGLPEDHPLLAALPAYALLPWIVSVYQENSREPELMLFVFNLLAVIFAALGFYYGACFAFEHPRPKLCLTTSLMAVVLLLTALADPPSMFHAVMSLGCVLLLLGQSYALLRSVFGPYWPVPQKEETENDS